MNSLFIRKDKRFKKGNIKVTNNELRGNPETMDMPYYKLPTLSKDVLKEVYKHTPNLYLNYMSLQLNPPKVISSELATEFKRAGLV